MKDHWTSIFLFRTTLWVALAFCLTNALVAVALVIDGADAIVVGEVSSGQQIGSHASFTIRVDGTSKGGIVVNSLVSVEWDKARPAATPQQLSGDYGVWCLPSTGIGSWQLLPGKSLFPLAARTCLLHPNKRQHSIRICSYELLSV